ncbi:PREDICTED: uncharacterized protein LOC106122499 [Papilio xuthus]|uniref:Uncharacterized protein LOC106122499 n=1 Tax=Papilio xuthus TaxID=66420 RepID=A0AAJ7EED0_PAPXU|nr:PREDICTED: uncharacterized protein LOC106122499 [Papilio xuthus]
MRSIWCLLLIFSLSNCFAWETSATSEALSALIDKLIAQTDTKPMQENIKYRESENNARAKLKNDSNVIYLKLVPNETYNLTLQPNATKSKESEINIDQEKSFIESNIQKILNSTNNKDVLKKILHDIKIKIDKNKPEQEIRTPANINSNENEDPSAYERNRSNGFVDLRSSESHPNILKTKKTLVLNDDTNIEKIVPDVLKTIKKQIPSIDVNDKEELTKEKFETKQTKDENLSPIEHIPSRRRYTSNEATAKDTVSRNNLLRNPSLLGSLYISSKTVPKYPLNLCGNCKHVGLVNLPLNNLKNNAMLQQVMRRKIISNFVNTIRPNLLYKNFNGINLK